MFLWVLFFVLIEWLYISLVLMIVCGFEINIILLDCNSFGKAGDVLFSLGNEDIFVGSASMRWGIGRGSRVYEIFSSFRYTGAAFILSSRCSCIFILVDVYIHFVECCVF